MVVTNLLNVSRWHLNEGPIKYGKSRLPPFTVHYKIDYRKIFSGRGRDYGLKREERPDFLCCR